MAKKKLMVDFDWHEAQMNLSNETQKNDMNFYLKRVAELEKNFETLKVQNAALLKQHYKFVDQKEALISAVDALSFVLTAEEKERIGNG